MVYQHTPESWLRYSKFSALYTGYLAWGYAQKSLEFVSHSPLIHVVGPEILPLHRQPYLLKFVIPTTNVLPRWSLNVETKTKRTLYSSSQTQF
jgi:hypothetical protein